DRISLVGPKAVEVAASVLGFTIDSDSVRNVDYNDSKVTVSSDTSRGVTWLDVVIRTSKPDLVSTFASAGAVEVNSDNFRLFRILQEIPGSDC
ncbi:MAG: hypothetical protein QGG20_00945, partial [Dehalococcoidia bacterium]|nr:hypothetical protein [Dehalococcoidia bacterium]